MTPKQPNQAQVLIGLAEAAFDVRRDVMGGVVGLPKTGARVVRPMEGHGATVTGALTTAFYAAHGRPPSKNALSDAVRVLDARAQEIDPVETHLRVARTEGGLVIDMGDTDGRAIRVRDGEWKVLKRAPDGIAFRRTTLTGPLPRPSRNGNLDLLREVLHVGEEDWDLVVAWLVCSLMPDVPAPILAAVGPQGAGKTFFARTLVACVDPSPAPVRSVPGSVSDWTVTASGSRVIALDNISSIPPWLSDALCRTVSGEGYAKRALYSDAGIHVVYYKRAIILTSIDPGGMRGDLGERLLPVRLERLPRGERRSERALQAQVDRVMPRVLGGLLDLVAEVLANPVRLDRLPRMADAAEVMAAVDATLGSHALDAYRAAQEHVTATVLESDPLSAALLRYMRDRDTWRGTPDELHVELSAYGSTDKRNWPANARTFSQRLARVEPALRDGPGLIVDRRRSKDRELRLRWAKGRRPLPPEGGTAVKGWAG